MSDQPSAQKRIFSYDDAVALLPEVRRVTEEAHRKVEALGVAPVPDEAAREALQSRLDEIVNGWARAIMHMGVAVKGLWLVDFDNGSGYYCWRYPEAGLDYYHSYEDGFRGRMRIQ